MLILGVSVKFAGRRLKDMRRGNAPGGHSPFVVFEEQGGFRLGSREAERAGIAWGAPGGLIFAQGAQTPGDFCFVKPFDRRLFRSHDGVEPFRQYELDGCSTILSDAGDETEGVSWGDVEFACPTTENDLVVRQKAP